MIRKFVAAAVIAAVCVTSGVTPVHGTSRSLDEQSRVFSTPPDKAVVYVYRQTIIGADASADIKVDNTLVGATKGRSFFKLALPPGHHVIESDNGSTSRLAIDVVAGQSYYVSQDVKFDIVAFRTSLRSVNASEGQAGIRKLKRIDSLAPQFGATAVAPSYAMAGNAMRPATPALASPVATSPAVAYPVADRATDVTSASPATTAPSVTASSEAASGSDLAVLDPRIDKPMFVAAQDLASSHQCERLLHVRTVDGGNAHLFSACPGSTTPIEILCNGASCHEGAPQG